MVDLPASGEQREEEPEDQRNQIHHAAKNLGNGVCKDPAQYVDEFVQSLVHAFYSLLRHALRLWRLEWIIPVTVDEMQHTFNSLAAAP